MSPSLQTGALTARPGLLGDFLVAMTEAAALAVNWLTSPPAPALRRADSRPVHVDDRHAPPAPVCNPTRVDVASVKEALSDLGLQRLNSDISDADFLRERDRILDLVRQSPILFPSRSVARPLSGSPRRRA